MTLQSLPTSSNPAKLPPISASEAGARLWPTKKLAGIVAASTRFRRASTLVSIAKAIGTNRYRCLLALRETDSRLLVVITSPELTWAFSKGHCHDCERVEEWHHKASKCTSGLSGVCFA